MNWIDVGIIVILIVFIAMGFWKGLIFSLLSVFSTFVNFCISIFLARPITNLLNNWFGMEGAMCKGFMSKFSSATPLFDTNMVGMSKSEISKHVAQTLSEGKVPFKKLLGAMIKISPEQIEAKETCTLNEILSKSFSAFFSLIIGFVISFAIIYLVLWIISLITKRTREIDGIRITDRILGVLFGLVKGFLFIAFLFSILSFFNEDSSLKSVFDYINQSQLGSWIFNVVKGIVDKYLNFNAVVKAVQEHKMLFLQMI